jgi:hypothetical protein
MGTAWLVMNRQKDGEGERGSEYFSDRSDSGSAVSTERGEFVGLLHAGVEPERYISYITSAQDLVEDIKDITGAIEVTMLESDA